MRNFSHPNQLCQIKLPIALSQTDFSGLEWNQNYRNFLLRMILGLIKISVDLQMLIAFEELRAILGKLQGQSRLKRSPLGQS